MSHMGRQKSEPVRVIYLFTSFPLLTETFLQREVRVLRTMRIKLSLYSLWGGSSEFEGMAVGKFPKWKILALVWWLPYWSFRRPRAFLEVIRSLVGNPMPSLLNAGETLIGICFATVYARRFEVEGPDLFHAVWSTMPATAAFFLAGLTGIPYSMGAHAYDVFENGGDWLLEKKLRNSQFVHTSSDATRRHLLELSDNPENVLLIRRGFDDIPPNGGMRSPREPIRILSVGRLVEKMGYFDQLKIYAGLKEKKVSFEARVVGEGRLRRSLQKQMAELGLEEEVKLVGSMVFDEVLKQFEWADLFLYTGKVADNGDRPGLPNALVEAMAVGVPVLASPVAGVVEAIEPGITGGLIDWNDSSSWLKFLEDVRNDDHFYEKVSGAARRWVEQNYDGRKNTGQLMAAFEELRSEVRV